MSGSRRRGNGHWLAYKVWTYRGTSAYRPCREFSAESRSALNKLANIGFRNGGHLLEEQQRTGLLKPPDGEPCLGDIAQISSFRYRNACVVDEYVIETCGRAERLFQLGGAPFASSVPRCRNATTSQT